MSRSREPIGLRLRFGTEADSGLCAAPLVKALPALEIFDLFDVLRTEMNACARIERFGIRRRNGPDHRAGNVAAFVGPSGRDDRNIEHIAVLEIHTDRFAFNVQQNFAELISLGFVKHRCLSFCRIWPCGPFSVTGQLIICSSLIYNAFLIVVQIGNRVLSRITKSGIGPALLGMRFGPRRDKSTEETSCCRIAQTNLLSTVRTAR